MKSEPTFFFFGCLEDSFTALPLRFADAAPAVSSAFFFPSLPGFACGESAFFFPAFFFPSLPGFAGGESAVYSAVFSPSPPLDKEGEAADADA
jgi:hypothetical protein